MSGRPGAGRAARRGGPLAAAAAPRTGGAGGAPPACSAPSPGTCRGRCRGAPSRSRRESSPTRRGPRAPHSTRATLKRRSLRVTQLGDGNWFRHHHLLPLSSCVPQPSSRCLALLSVPCNSNLPLPDQQPSLKCLYSLLPPHPPLTCPCCVSYPSFFTSPHCPAPLPPPPSPAPLLPLPSLTCSDDPVPVLQDLESLLRCVSHRPGQRLQRRVLVHPCATQEASQHGHVVQTAAGDQWNSRTFS